MAQGEALARWHEERRQAKAAGLPVAQIGRPKTVPDKGLPEIREEFQRTYYAMMLSPDVRANIKRMLLSKDHNQVASLLKVILPQIAAPNLHGEGPSKITVVNRLGSGGASSIDITPKAP